MLNDKKATSGRACSVNKRLIQDLEGFLRSMMCSYTAKINASDRNQIPVSVNVGLYHAESISNIWALHGPLRCRVLTKHHSQQYRCLGPLHSPSELPLRPS